MSSKICVETSIHDKFGCVLTQVLGNNPERNIQEDQQLRRGIIRRILNTEVDK